MFFNSQRSNGKEEGECEFECSASNLCQKMGMAMKSSEFRGNNKHANNYNIVK